MSRRFKIVEEPKIEERFDYAEEVRKQIDRCTINFSNHDGTVYSETLCINSILALENLIPKSDRDEELEKDIDEALEEVAFDIRPEWCGYIINVKTCIEEGYAIEEIRQVMNIHKYFQALFNQFVRLKVAVRRTSRVG